MPRLITFHQFYKLIHKDTPDPRQARRTWNTVTFELMYLGEAFHVSDDERVVGAEALKLFLGPRRRLRHLRGIGKRSEEALRKVHRRL